ncbi:hypothetical protein ACG873_24955 [Mesorhizobium sp. AaZ16]|uniref:hypothetical protein n=1 Tax=Mesorhizobium sp. AaZ16 TaxID=3402289 RepID=UPI00374EAF57
MTNTKPAEPTQIDKFKSAARELETDQSEEAFDRALKKIARPNSREAADRRAVDEAKTARAKKIAKAPPKDDKPKKAAT